MYYRPLCLHCEMTYFMYHSKKLLFKTVYCIHIIVTTSTSGTTDSCYLTSGCGQVIVVNKLLLDLCIYEEHSARICVVRRPMNDMYRCQ